MKRIIVIGCPGSGKSTFSKALHKTTGIPLYHLDMMYWNKDRTKVQRELFLRKLNEVLDQDCWIIDGNYESTMDMRIEKCDAVFFLDYPIELCIEGIMSRRGKERSDMPWVEKPDEIDEGFLEWVKNYNVESRPKVLEILAKNVEKEIIIFHSREEAKEYLENIKE
ncbi:MAG: adenylate kinase [Lachnospiraceae bacterium]|nr:adenylate kinase [Lachnospiraceae bacterium]